MSKKERVILIILFLIISAITYIYGMTEHGLSIYGKNIVNTETILTPDQFKKQLLYLEAMGYSTIHFKDYIEFKENGKKLPDNPIIITFDDGYYSNYEYAYPILKELNMKATIFAIGWSVGREYDKDNITPISRHFSWNKAKEMYDSGLIDIQCHSYDLHSINGDERSTNKLPNETQTEYAKRFKEDTLNAKQLIESNVGNKVIVYSYPLGFYNDITEEVLKETGFKASLTTQYGISDFSNGLYLLKRINMPSMKSKELINKILLLQNRNIKIPYNIDIRVQLMFLLIKSSI